MSATLLSMKFYRRHWVLVLAIALLLLSLVLPNFNLPKRTYHYVVTFDISQSMGVPDMLLDRQPVSRLQYARQAASNMLSQLPCGSTIGWSIFTEHRTFALLLPLEVCAHYETLVSTLDRIGPDMRWRDSSQVGKGLFWSIRNSESDPDSLVVFVSDGHEAPPKRPGQQLMPELSEKVRGWVVGVGAEQASRIPKTDTDGRTIGYWSADDVVQSEQAPEHLSALREEHMRALADFAGLDYLRLEQVDGLSQAMMNEAMAKRLSAPTSVSWIPALLALLALCWQFTLRRRS